MVHRSARAIGLATAAALATSICVPSAARADRDDGASWSAPPGRSLTQRLVIADSEPANYWATQWFFTSDPALPNGNGGYIGVQSQAHDGGGVGRIFSVWGATDFRNADGSCVLNAQMENGSGGQCSVNAWPSMNTDITVRVDRASTGQGPVAINSSTMVDGTWWRGTVQVGSNSSVLGQLFVPGTQHRLNVAGNFNEAFSTQSNLPGCLHYPYSTRVTWWPPVITDDAGIARAATLNPSAAVKPCPASSRVVNGAFVLDRGPHVLPAATGTNAQFVSELGRLYISGFVTIDFGANAVGITSTVNGSPTPYNAVSAAVAGRRPYRVLAAQSPANRAGATFCAVAENGPRSNLGCLKVLAGTLGATATSMTGQNGTGTIRGQVTRSGVGISTLVRTRVGGTTGSAVTSGSNGVFVAPFRGAPAGAQICAEANEHGVWIKIGCRAINSGSLTSVTGGQAKGTVNNTLFPGPIMVRAYINGTYYSARYSNPGPGPRAYSLPINASRGATVCVKADSYGHQWTLGCRPVP